jgi:subtilisin family serine protease
MRRTPFLRLSRIALVAVLGAVAACQTQGRIAALRTAREVDAFLARPVVDTLEDGTTEPRYIVLLREPGPVPDSVRTRLVEEFARDFVQREGGRLRHIFTAALYGFSATLRPAAAEKLRDTSAVVSVDFVNRGRVLDEQANPPWGLDRVDQRDQVLDDRYVYQRTGNQVNVYVIDTGIRISHRDFSARARALYDVYCAVPYEQSRCTGGQDVDGHGTHVAGIIGGDTHGVAKRVNLFSVRVLDHEAYTEDDLIEGIDTVIKYHHKPAIINISLGGPEDPHVDQAVANAVDSGITVVMGAGNESMDACLRSPAGQVRGITVGGSMRLDHLFNRTNSGTCVDLFAPAVKILSAAYENDSATEERYGTSMAAPHVAGAAALFLQVHPRVTPKAVEDYLICTATRESLTIGTAQTGTQNLLLFTAPHGVEECETHFRAAPLDSATRASG